MINRLALIVLVFCSLLNTACNYTYKIDGKTGNDLNGKTVYIKVCDDTKFIVIDSCSINEGSFILKGSRDSVEFAQIFIDNTLIGPVILDGNVNFNITYENQSITGTILNDSLNNFMQAKQAIDNKIVNLNKKFYDLVSKGYEINDIEQQLAAERIILEEENENLILNFIKSNINNILGVGLFTMVTQDFPYPILTPTIEEIFAVSNKYFKQNSYVSKYFSTAEENMLRIRNNEQPINLQ